MKTEKQIEKEIDKLEKKIEKIWNGKDELMKLDKIEVLRQRIITLEWVLGL